ncbi:hypothetical protein COV93_08460 [Candidatus Woesearchaeota archaeon CG11_big_fil_rev_8_21_14_0_20_43_8]|nr:MAG: hypothetical protein COV93_08460 [Candidatus Woesearchaeota archaeon CG11_big_fil_rev_8_21_14_0_20_43_8]PIO05176.1 MAG: hypothetical protein COT47_05900 [Candidatus Woesearchaeota archaeon CG08_land_8_20_14_0_20_43_7]
MRIRLIPEWKKRNADDPSILTNEITEAAFGKTVSEYEKQKNLKKQNLRDHMTSMESIITMFAEAVTEEITKNAKDLKKAARLGGKVAGKARKEAEKYIARP